MPSHHQTGFFRALREAGHDLHVHYYGSVSAARRGLGWADSRELPEGERFVPACISSLEACPDWRKRLHIVPGYGNPFLRRLVCRLSAQGATWAHWSEPARPGLRWWVSLPLKRWYARLVNNHAVTALAIGEMARRDFVQWGIRRNKIDLLPYAVEGFPVSGDADATVAQFAELHRPCFVYVGMLSHRKGIDLLLESFSMVARRFPNVGLALVGSDSGDLDYRGLAAELGIGEKVLFRGALPANQIGPAVRPASVLVLPSRFDGWGMPLNEGASLAKALIATDRCGSAHHLIQEGQNGFRVPAGEVNALADRMERYARVPQLAEVHGRHSLKVFSDHTPEANTKRLSAILQKVGFSNPAGRQPP